MLLCLCGEHFSYIPCPLIFSNGSFCSVTAFFHFSFYLLWECYPFLLFPVTWRPLTHSTAHSRHCSDYTAYLWSNMFQIADFQLTFPLFSSLLHKALCPETSLLKIQFFQSYLCTADFQCSKHWVPPNTKLVYHFNMSFWNILFTFLKIIFYKRIIHPYPCIINTKQGSEMPFEGRGRQMSAWGMMYTLIPVNSHAF